MKSPVILLLALPQVGGLASAQQLDPTWTVSAGGFVVAPDPDGSFTLWNIPADETPQRVIGTRTVGGVTEYAYSETFVVADQENYHIQGFTFADSPPLLPGELEAGGVTFLLVGETGQLTVTGEVFGGSLQDFTASASGTTYVSSNPTLLTVGAEGAVTALAEGPAFVAVTNSGVTTSALIDVVDPAATTTLVGFVVDADGEPAAGVEIELPAFQLTASTAIDGSFAFADVPAGLGDLFVQTSFFEAGSWFATQSPPIEPNAGSFTDAGVLQLQPANFLYVSFRDAQSSGSKIAAFSIAQDGSLSEVPGSPFVAGGAVAGAQIGAMAISPDGRHLVYARAENDGTYRVFEIAIDGSLNEVSTLTGVPSTDAFEFADTGLLYTGFLGTFAGNMIGVLQLDADGQLSQLPGTTLIGGFDLNTPIAVELTPDQSRLLALHGGFTTPFGFANEGVTVLDVGPGTELTVSTALGLMHQQGARALSVSGDGSRVFVVAQESGTEFPDVLDVLDLAPDGTLAPVPGSAFLVPRPPNTFSAPQDCLSNHGGSVVYVVRYLLNSSFDDIPGDVTPMAIAPDGTATPHPGGSLPVGLFPAGLAFSPDGGTLYTASGTEGAGAAHVHAFRVQPDGSLVELGPPIAVSGVPEAGSLASPLSIVTR